jgi:hypothetical protein
MAGSVISNISGRFSNASSGVSGAAARKSTTPTLGSRAASGAGQGNRLLPHVEKALAPFVQVMRKAGSRTADLVSGQAGAAPKMGGEAAEAKAESQIISAVRQARDVVRGRGSKTGGAGSSHNGSKLGSTQPKNDIANMSDLDGLELEGLDLKEATHAKPPVMRMRGGAGSSDAKATGGSADSPGGDGPDDASSMASMNSDQMREAFTENPEPKAKAPPLSKGGSLPLTAANLRKHNLSFLPKSSSSKASVASKPGDASENDMEKAHGMAQQDMTWELVQQLKQQVTELKEKRLMGWLRHLGQLNKDAGNIAG